jgi:phytoene/squalene synthetase
VKKEGSMRTTTEERAAMCLHRAAMKRVARRASRRGLMSHLLRIGLFASIEPANCDVFSCCASLPAREKHWPFVSAAWRFRWRAS